MPDLFDSNIPIVLFLFRTESPTIDEALFGVKGKADFSTTQEHPRLRMLLPRPK